MSSQILTGLGHTVNLPTSINLSSTSTFPFTEVRFRTTGKLEVSSTNSGLLVTINLLPSWAGYYKDQTGLVGNYEVLAHLNSSSNTTFTGSNAFDTWLPLSTERVWATNGATSGPASAVYTLTIRSAASGQTLASTTCSITMIGT